MAIKVERGDIVLVDLSGAVGTEKQNDPDIDARPCLVVQNNRGNTHSPMTIIAPITEPKIEKRNPVLVQVTADDLGSGGKASVIDCGQLRTIDCERRIRRVQGRLSSTAMLRVDEALRVSLAL